MLNAMIIGNKITEARKNKNLSQAALANHLSISSQAVGKWERGESMPDIITFDRMAEVLGVDLNYFSENFESKGVQTVETKEDDIPSKGRRSGFNMSGGNWVDVDFSGLRNLSKRFSGSNIQKSQFIGSDLSEMKLNGNNVIDCDFEGSNLMGSKFSGSNIQKNAFKGCNLRNTVFSASNLDRCDFTGADFTGAILGASAFVKNTITDTVWKNTEFRKSGFAEIVFEGRITECCFDNCNYSKTEFRNVVFNNTFFKGKGIKKIKFTNCKADNITIAFLKSGNADLTGLELIAKDGE